MFGFFGRLLIALWRVRPKKTENARARRIEEKDDSMRTFIATSLYTLEEAPGTFSIFLSFLIILFPVSLTSRSPRHRLPFEHGGTLPIPLAPAVISASSPLFSAFSLSATAVAERSTATWTIARWWYLANTTACLFAIWRTAMSVCAPLLA